MVSQLYNRLLGQQKTTYPEDPRLHRQYLIDTLGLSGSLSSSDEVLDLTHHLERGGFIGKGGYGEVYKGRWQNKPKPLPPTAIKVVPIPQATEKSIKKGHKARIISTKFFNSSKLL